MPPGFNAGSVFARLGAVVDRRGFEQFDRIVNEADRKKVEAALGGDFNPRAFDAYDKAVKESRAASERRSKMKTELGADFDAKGFRAYEKALKQQNAGIDSNVKAQGRLRTAFGSVYGSGGAMLAAAGGAYGLVTGLKAVVSAANDAETSATRVRKAVTNQGFAYEAHAKQIDRVIQKQSQLAALDDEDLADSFARLLPLTKNINEALKLNALAADVARGRNIGLDAAQKLVGKAFMGNAGALKKLGIEIDPVTKGTDRMRQATVDQIDALQKQAAVAKGPAKQAILDQIKDIRDGTTARQRDAKEQDKQATGQRAIAQLSKNYAGSAAAYGRTAQGSIDRLGVAWENLQETIGKRAGPTIAKVMNALAKFVTEMQEGTGAGGRFVDRLEEIANKGQALARFLKDHAALIKLAATAWVAYKVAALASIGASKAAGAAALLSGRTAAGGAAGRAAAGAAGAAGAGGAAAAAGRFGGIGGAVKGGIVVAGAATIASQILRGPSGPDTGLLNKYADALLRVTKAGDSQGMRKLAGQLREAANANKDLTKGENLHRFADALDETAAKGGKNISSIAAAFRKLEKSSGGSLEQVRKDITSLARTRGFDQVNKEVDRAAANFADWRRTGSNNIKGLRMAVAENTQSIKHHLGEDTQEGKDALAKNFRLARAAIRTAMNDGKISVKTGLSEIQKMMRAELKQYGITGKTASAIIKHGNIGADGGDTGTGNTSQGAQRGGWIGSRGMVSQDVVPIGNNAIAAFGEFVATGPGGQMAVINRHQAPVADLALAMGGYGSLDTISPNNSLSILEDAMAPLGGLDALFSSITRPHYLASGGRFAAGGIVPVPGFPGERAAASVIPMIEKITSMFGLRLTDAFGAGHKSPGHTKFGTAADFAGPDRSMDAAVRYLVGQGYLVGYDGRFGSQRWPGHGPTRVAGANAHLHAELGSGGGGGGGAIAAAIKKLRAPRTGATGALGAIAQGALNAVTAGANSRLQDIAASSVATPVGGGGGGGANASVVRRWLAAGLRLAGQPATPRNINTLFGRAMQESGGNPRAVNNWDSNAKRGDPSRGLLQTIMATFKAYMVKGHGNVFNPVDNTAAAVRYMMARYGHLVGASGSGYARGGRTSKGSRKLASGRPHVTSSGPQAGSQFTGFRIKPLANLNRGRSNTYDDLADAVEGLESKYANKDRLFNLSIEEFTNDDGSVNKGAVDKRVKQLNELLGIRQMIVTYLHSMQTLAARMRKTYQTIIKRLKSAIRHTKGKSRTNYKTELSHYEQALGDVTGDLTDLRRNKIPQAEIDVVELQREITSVANTAAAPPDTDAFPDSDAGGGGSSDTSASDGTTDPDAQAVTDQLQRRLAVATEGQRVATGLLAAFTSSGDIGIGGTSALAAARNDAPGITPVGTGAVPAGTQFFQNNYMLTPSDPAVLRQLANATVGGMAFQPNVANSVKRLGV